MPTYNKVILCGHLTRDPELRTTPKGTAICQFGLAVNEKFKDASGELRENVSFFDVDVWGRQAEAVAKYCRKGAAVLLDGKLRQESWDDKQTGQKRSKVKVIADNIQFLGGKAGADTPAKSAPVGAASAADVGGETDSVPF